MSTVPGRMQFLSLQLFISFRGGILYILLLVLIVFGISLEEQLSLIRVLTLLPNRSAVHVKEKRERRTSQ